MGLKAAMRTARTKPAIWNDNDVTNVSSITTATVKYFALRNYSASNTSRHDHTDYVCLPSHCPAPNFTLNERFGIAIYIYG
jgi:hypothetical protein